MRELKNRKTPRLKDFDYNSAGMYFITICTKDRKPILSNVGAGVLDCPQIELTRIGEIVDKYINQLDSFYEYMSVESYVIMPNHIHILLWIKANAEDVGQSGTPVPTRSERSNSLCSQFVSTLKRFANKEYGENIWQARFYDHIIRNQRDYEEHMKYIYENPIRWNIDELYTKTDNDIVL